MAGFVVALWLGFTGFAAIRGEWFAMWQLTD
ncbi:MAG: DUF2165 family protein [Ottowia sp.]|nr:DUF2165 family protein [Ottowia sp.]